MTDEQNDLLKAIAGGVLRLLCERATYLIRCENGLPDIVERTTQLEEAATTLLEAVKTVNETREFKMEANNAQD